MALTPIDTPTKDCAALMLEEIISYAHNLERVLDNLKEGIIAHDTRRRIFFFNQEAEKNMRANKALEPTTMPVTFRAYARTAPGMVAAQF